MQTPIDMPQTLRELDRRFAENDLAGAGEYLDAALSLARKTGDTAAVLSLRSEQVGYFRKTGEKEKALEAIDEALRLCDMLQLRSTVTERRFFSTAQRPTKPSGRARGHCRCIGRQRRCMQRCCRKTTTVWRAFTTTLPWHFATLHNIRRRWRFTRRLWLFCRRWAKTNATLA